MFILMPVRRRATLQIIGDAGFEYSFDALHSSVAEGEEHAFLAAMHENLLQVLGCLGR